MHRNNQLQVAAPEYDTANKSYADTSRHVLLQAEKHQQNRREFRSGKSLSGWNYVDRVIGVDRFIDSK